MRRSLLTVVALFSLPVTLAAQGQVVGPAGGSSSVTPDAISTDPTPWHVSRQSGAFADVTANNPCGLAASGSACGDGFGGVGSGSLELKVTGLQGGDGQYPEWAFWYLFAGGQDGSGSRFGDLQDLTAMSFDWFRAEADDAWRVTPPLDDPRPIAPFDWRWKTPVMRLQLMEHYVDELGVAQSVRSELVWEGYFNQPRIAEHGAPDGYTPVNQWVTQRDMQRDAFWYVRQPAVGGTPGYSVNDECAEPTSFWAGGITPFAVNGLFSEGGCFFGASAVDVIGVGLGVGSQWPLPYHGFVDNLRLGFGGQDDLAINTNWDVPATTVVPEPSAFALLLVGIGAMAVAARRRLYR